MTDTSDSAARPSRSSTVAWRVIEGEAVMVLPATGQVHTLNAVGTRFWELVDGERTLGEIAAALADEFEAPIDRITDDCRQFALELTDRRLLGL